jgi:hypothetical protein
MTSQRQNSGARRDAAAMQQLDKCMSIAMDVHATMQELLEAVFSMQSVLRLHGEGHCEKLASHD